MEVSLLMISPLMTALLSLICLPFSVFAEQQSNSQNYDGIDYLLKSLNKAGITISFDGSECYGHEEGAYIKDQRKIIFCEPKPTFHALKHESWHVLQHCKMWKYDDTLTSSFHSWKEPLLAFIKTSGIDSAEISETYKKLGADPSAILLELEAEAASASYSSKQIADLITNNCLAKQ